MFEAIYNKSQIEMTSFRGGPTVVHSPEPTIHKLIGHEPTGLRLLTPDAKLAALCLPATAIYRYSSYLRRYQQHKYQVLYCM